MICGYIGGINDGYTEKGYIKEAAGFYPALRFEFRPFLIEEQVRYNQGAKKLNGPQVNAYAAEWLKEKVLSWDLMDHRGRLVPITAETMLGMKIGLFNRLFAVVAGEEPADFPPEAKPAEIAAQTNAQVDAEETDQHLRAVLEARDAKNL